MKVRINFNSDEFDEIVEFRDQLIDLIDKIDSYLGPTDDLDCDECDCDEEVCTGHCCECDKDTKCDNTDDSFVSDARNGYVAKFINESKDECGFCKEIEFDNKFIKAFADVKGRSDDNEHRKNIVEKLIKAGLTKAFANHVVEHCVSVDPEKIPTEYSDEGFKKLMEYLCIKEDFEKQKVNEASKAIKDYLTKQLIEISKTDRDMAVTLKHYFERFKPTKISDIDKGIETFKKIFGEPIESEDESENVVDVKFEGNEIRGHNKRPPLRKSATDNKSDKTK